MEVAYRTNDLEKSNNLAFCCSDADPIHLYLLSFLQHHNFDPEHEAAIWHPKQLETGKVVV